MPKNKKSTSTKKKSSSVKKAKNLSEAYVNHPKTKALSDPNKFRQYVKDNYHLIREKQPLMKGSTNVDIFSSGGATDIMKTLGADWKMSKTYGASKPKINKLTGSTKDF